MASTVNEGSQPDTFNATHYGMGSELVALHATSLQAAKRHACKTHCGSNSSIHMQRK